MIYVFRLSRLTTATHAFTIGKDIRFEKMRLLGVQLDNCDGAASTLSGTTSETPIYLECSLLDNDSIVFNNGKATAITAGGTRLIPIGAVGTDLNSIELANGTGITLIDEPTHLAAADTVTWALKELNNAGTAVTTLIDDCAFGTDVDESEGVVHRGVNIIVKFDLQKDSHNYNGNVTIANSV